MVKKEIMISIIIPVYNSEKYLKRCIDCVINQTYNDWELILINDGSIDKSGEICELYVKQNSRIHCIHQENAGASIARKNGIEHSRGEYLTFVDSDDFIEPLFLKSLYEALKGQKVMISACSYSKHKENEERFFKEIAGTIILEEKDIFKRFFNYEFWGFWGKLYNRNVFEGIYIPPYTLNEDYVVMLQIFNKYKRMAFVDTPLYHYIIHDNSLSNQKISKRALDEYYNKAWAYNYSQKHMTNYIKQTEAQLTETCIKLIRMIKESRRIEEYNNEYLEMKHFLRLHLSSILTNKHLLLGLKIMTLKSII